MSYNPKGIISQRWYKLEGRIRTLNEIDPFDQDYLYQTLMSDMDEKDI